MRNQKVIICGLPASGKTTFLAALWHMLSQKEVKTKLDLRSLPKNREYLNSISRKWCRFIEIFRTPLNEVQEILLQLKSGSSEVDLYMPDMSGETWQAIWTTRSLSEKAAEWVQRDSDVMLFIHADNIRPPIDIMTQNEMIRATGEEPIDEQFSEWSPNDTPTQVILVDILQALSMPPVGKKGRRIVVIISAWDKAEDAHTTPEIFLKTHLPLLFQYLKHNGRYSDVAFFGVSAQGGDLDIQEDAERLKLENIPSNRIKVVSDNSKQNDLTLPINWLIS